MESKRILFVSQEISPYLPENQISKSALEIAKKMNEIGHEVRVFMPRFGVINERRHQLHEVIRLSGINIIINDMDLPLVIKVASVPTTRMQVYFIDNDEFFKRKATYFNTEHKFFDDNAERTVFFCKGVIETVKKLGWKPDIIHVHGWMASMLPVYLKTFHADDPLFIDSKIVMSIYDYGFEGQLHNNFINALEYDGFDAQVVEGANPPNFKNLMITSTNFVDATIKADDKIDADVLAHIKANNIPLMEGAHLTAQPQDIEAFYENTVLEESVA